MSGEDAWIWRTCSRGHALREHGVPRTGKPHLFHCRACQREWDREYRERHRETPEYGWRGREHMCLHLHSQDQCAPDETAVERLIRGEAPALFHTVDKIEAIKRLDRKGLSAARIASLVGCTPRTVVRMRGRIREDAGYGTPST